MGVLAFVGAPVKRVRRRETMQRRKFILGAGSTAIGASAVIGSGAFSRVESQRSVTVAAAEDPDAYVGLEPSDSPNGENYATVSDETGHLEIDIADSSNGGHGVNSNSVTWFDCVFTVRNQGKAEADFYIEDMEGLGEDEGEVDFYTGDASGSEGDDGTETIVGQENSQSLTEGGEPICVGIRVNSEEDGQDDIDLDVTLIADSPDAGAPDNDDE